MENQVVKDEGVNRQMCYDQDLEAWIKLIESLLKDHKYVKAEECFRWALSMSPNCEKLWMELGNLLLELNQFSEAEKCYEKAVKINPEYKKARRFLIRNKLNDKNLN